MAIVPQHATVTADGSGDALFAFPDVPQGELWCGTTTIPGAPSSAVGMVLAGGQLVGSFYGPGSYGPWTCDYSQRLTLSVTGLVPGEQYQAVWHADSEGKKISTYPAPITPTVVTGGGTVIVTNFPAIQTVDGTVDVGNFPATQPVSGTVTTEPTLATTPASGATTMTGAPVTLPSHVALEGVTLSAPSTNGNPITIGGGYVMEPGQTTPLWPIANLDALTANGTSPDVVSWMVT